LDPVKLLDLGDSIIAKIASYEPGSASIEFSTAAIDGEMPWRLDGQHLILPTPPKSQG
jgi:hypothetical protein